VPADDHVLPSRVAWRNLHSDEANTDEVSIALAPVFREGWTAEPETFNATGPVFDSKGNLYFSAALPHEDVVLVSLDPNDGSRRFAIPNTTGAVPGTGSPMILADPVGGEPEGSREMVFQALYDRAIALETDGSVIWDVPTGLISDGLHFVFGVNYAPAVDAVVGLTDDGFVYALDRLTGEPLLHEPFQLPGENSPPGAPSTLPPEVFICLALDLAEFVNLSEFPLSLVSALLLGNDVKVANFFSIDANTSSLWIAATASDEEDGVVDGVSKFGALYKLEFVASGDKHDIVEVCHASFEGGSASTPALRTDGTRGYVADNVGKLIAIDTADCSKVWEVDVGKQIRGSVGVSSDNNEIYAATRAGIFQVIDQGDAGVVNWMSDLDAFDLPPEMIPMNMTVVSVGANAVSFQIGAGFPPDRVVTEGIAQLDRETGALRYVAVGGEASIGVMNTGPDGALYMGNSGFRSAITNCTAEAELLPVGGGPLVGGITKFVPERLDLLARDAICAAGDRAANAAANRDECPASAEADVVQIEELIAQARDAGSRAIQDGDLSPQDWVKIEEELTAAEEKLNPERLQDLTPAGQALQRACEMLN
jgi:outer membrane protein assembly factor BamB